MGYLNELEKQILVKMRKIKNKSITPKESKIGFMMNRMKESDEVLYTELIEKYKEILQEIK